MCPNLSRHEAYSITRWQRCHLLRRCPTSSPRCTSTILWKALRTLEQKLLTYFITVCQKSFWETRCSGRSGEREVSAQTSRSSEDPRASGKPAVLFSPKQRNQMWSSVFENATPSNWNSARGNKDHLLSQARSDLAKRELHVESLDKCIGD